MAEALTIKTMNKRLKRAILRYFIV